MTNKWTRRHDHHAEQKMEMLRLEEDEQQDDQVEINEYIIEHARAYLVAETVAQEMHGTNDGTYGDEEEREKKDYVYPISDGSKH